MPAGAGLGAARGVEMVGAKAELADDESASELLALVPEIDWPVAEATLAEIITTMAAIGIRRQKIEDRKWARRIFLFGIKKSTRKQDPEGLSEAPLGAVH